jgi:hypothetical protein
MERKRIAIIFSRNCAYGSCVTSDKIAKFFGSHNSSFKSNSFNRIIAHNIPIRDSSYCGCLFNDINANTVSVDKTVRIPVIDWSHFVDCYFGVYSEKSYIKHLSVSNSIIYGTVFENITFTDTCFIHCAFINTTFINCTFDEDCGIDDCSFSGCKFVNCVADSSSPLFWKSIFHPDNPLGVLSSVCDTQRPDLLFYKNMPISPNWIYWVNRDDSESWVDKETPTTNLLRTNIAFDKPARKDKMILLGVMSDTVFTKSNVATNTEIKNAKKAYLFMSEGL